MKPWMWGVLALVVGLGLVLVLAATLGGDPLSGRPGAVAEDPPQTPPTPQSASADTPRSTTAPDEAPVSTTDSDEPGRGIPGIDPDAPSPMDEIPEHVTQADFDQVLDAVVEQCGLDDWSELERRCEGVRCTWLLAQPPPDAGYPSHEPLIRCAAWADAWGAQAESVQSRVTCDDGVELELVSFGPTTERMLAAVAQGAELIEAPDDLRRRACAAWGE